MIGVAKRNTLVDIGLLEHAVRQNLNKTSPRAMAVMRPLRVVIVNYPENQVEHMEAINNPEDPSMGIRQVPFSRLLYIERDDFRENPPKKFYRLAPGREVRLRYAYFIKCVDVVKDKNTGEISELHCTYDPQTRGGSAPDGRRVKATLHWVSAAHALKAEVRLYDRLFLRADPSGDRQVDFKTHLNPDSLEILYDCPVEPSLSRASPGSLYQFERQGYFCTDSKDTATGRPVFNRTVSLRDSWAKIEGTVKY